MGGFKIIIKKNNVPDNAKAIRKDAKFIRITKMSIYIHLFCIRAGSRHRRHEAVSHLVGGNIRLILIKSCCPVPEDKRLCPDCDTPTKTIAWQFVREELRITPAKVERVHYPQEVLACPVCREEDTGTIVKEPVPTVLLPHSLASPLLMAFVMYQKFMNSVSFYRQEMDSLQMGELLARETTANWCIKCAFLYFQPVYDRLHEYPLKREVLHTDETVCQVFHEEGKAAESNSYMWIYLTGNDGLPQIILYEYQSGKKGEYAKNFLEGFSGLLECDGYSGYHQVENVTLVCCLTHCRRYFYEAVPAGRRRKIKLLDICSTQEIPREAADPERAKEEKKIPAEIGLSYCNQLFRIEQTLKDLPAEGRKEKRLEWEVPIWESFWEWLGTLKPFGGQPAGKGGQLRSKSQGTAYELPVGREM